MTRAEMHALLINPKTGVLLDRLLADNRRVDAEIADAEQSDGPRPCCGEFGYCTKCDGEIDEFTCGICGRTWEAVCPDSEIWQPEE